MSVWVSSVFHVALPCYAEMTVVYHESFSEKEKIVIHDTFICKMLKNFSAVKCRFGFVKYSWGLEEREYRENEY